MTKIKVQGRELNYLNKEETLLECLESADIEVHYHCRDGFCGACRVTLTSGQVAYPKGEPLAFIADGEILPCCCMPITDISIEVDE
ncbi:class I ribonucleotide reductase maintenance protein YfaE [Litorilituus sediminis]|uniref:2Fe-2S ferredoxin-like protein n=1 Tax=Litorilituus sediminis TaxID=718192 RepID=A0A4P6P106_9GAMM|nr:class I ribonucleotide reductase maintenance protein YfaE [Litorilituus sediminis]QBG34574.1 2Fe-2S ferredoxin-like protein [Litorilituus sediminis]